MAISLMHQWHDTICSDVIGPWRAYGCILGTLFRSVQDVTLLVSGKLTNVKRHVASLKSKVEGLEQKIDTLKNDLNDTKSQRDADLENLSSFPLYPPVYKRM
nr:hypothetical protein [Tanacetum cinerariifolium]